MGAPSDWYELLQAARYVGVAPWDLAEKPMWWFEHINAARSVEAHAQALHQKRQTRTP